MRILIVRFVVHGNLISTICVIRIALIEVILLAVLIVVAYGSA